MRVSETKARRKRRLQGAGMECGAQGAAHIVLLSKTGLYVPADVPRDYPWPWERLAPSSWLFSPWLASDAGSHHA